MCREPTDGLSRMATLIVLILIQSACSFQFAPLTVSSNQSIINQPATYTVEYDRSSFSNYSVSPYATELVPSSAIVTLTFPAQFSAESSFDSISCTVSVNGGNANAHTCSQIANQIAIEGVFDHDTIVAGLIVVVNNVLNPSPARQTSQFKGTIGDDNSYEEGGGRIDLLPGTFQSCEIRFNPTSVNSTSDMVLSLKPANSIGPSSTISIEFPRNVWSEDISTTNLLPFSSSMACSNLSANVKQTIRCHENSPTIIEATNLLQVLTNDALSFSVNNFLSPPTVAPTDEITITSYSSDYEVDACTVRVSGLTAKPLASLSLTDDSNNSIQVNTQNTLKFRFQISDSVKGSDYFTIQFPTPLSLQFSASTLSGFPNTVGILSNYNTTTGIATLKMSSGLAEQIYVSGLLFIINIGSYTSPPSVEPTGPFIVSIYRGSAMTQQGSVTLTATSSQVTASMTQTSSTVNAITSYTFTIVTEDALSSDGLIQITIPQQITISFTGSSCGTASGNEIAEFPVCTVTDQENSITFSGLNATAANIPAQTLSIIVQGLKNPVSAAPTPDFSIRTYYHNTDSSLVAEGTIAGVTSTTANINSQQIQILPSSYVVNANPVSYSFVLNVTNPIPMGGSLRIYIPTAVYINLASVSNRCEISLDNTTFSTTTCQATAFNSTYSRVLFPHPFQNTEVIVGDLLTARVNSVMKNPASTVETDSFGLETFDANNFSIASIGMNLTVKMQFPSQFEDIVIGRDSEKNYELTTYNFALTQAVPIAPSSILKITFPADIVPLDPSSCSISTPVNSGMTCTVSGLVVTLTLPAQTINAGIRLTVSIGQVRNLASFAPSGSFLFKTLTPDGLDQYCAEAETPALRNSVPSTFQSISSVYSPRQLDSEMELSLDIDPSNSGNPPSYFLVTLPNSFRVSNLQCSDFAGSVTSASCSFPGGHTLRVDGLFTQNEFSFKITGFRSGESMDASTYVSIVSFDPNNYQQDQSSSDVSLSLSCSLPCQTCSSNQSQCLSCYANPNVTSKVYYDSALRQCFQNCLDGKFEDIVSATSLVCSNCSSNCQTCSSYDFCLSCAPTSTHPFLLRNTSTQECVDSCPAGMYADNSLDPVICTGCPGLCAECSDLNACAVCISGAYFYNNSCLPECPDSYYIEDDVNNECDACDTNCRTCSGSISICTSCTEDLLLYSGQCLPSCPGDLVPENGTCGTCDSSCKTCINDLYTCTTCQNTSSLPYFYQNTCLDDCPETYYEDLSRAMCSQCSSVLHLHCSNCSTETACLSCDVGYVFHLQQCLETTPVGFANVSGVAQACQGDCATCENTVFNCTSCHTLKLLMNKCYADCPPTYTGSSTSPMTCDPCLSPCKTCENSTTNCLSCLTNILPEVFLSGNLCLERCPAGMFADVSTNQCMDCVSPCEQCESQGYCLTCLNGEFALNGVCYRECPDGYVGLGGSCQTCLGNCLTCQNSRSSCLTCKSSTFLMNSSDECLNPCPAGFFGHPLTRECTVCTAPCATCVNSSTTCLTCSSGSMFQDNCLSSCPSKYYSRNSICLECPSQCSSCVNSFCTTCIATLVLYNGACISSCPDTHAVIQNSVCTSCSTAGCQKCTGGDYCFSCTSDYSLLLGSCENPCPRGYETNGTHCIDTNQQLLSNDSPFPVPFSIALTVIMVACLMSKMQFKNTFMPGAVFSLLGVIEWGALIYYIILYYQQYFQMVALPFYIGVGALAYLYLLNFLAAILQNLIFLPDPLYRSWYRNGCPCKASHLICNTISVIISHKFRNILFSKLFTFVVFSAALESTAKLRVINIFSFLSLLHSASAIVAAAFPLIELEPGTQLFYASLDVIICTGINAILAFFNVLKPKTYFYERTGDGFDLKRKIAIEDQSIDDKLEPAGSDSEAEQGPYSNYYHVQGSSVLHPFPDFESNHDVSNSNFLSEKEQQQASVQAEDIIYQQDEKHEEAKETLKTNTNSYTAYYHESKRPQSKRNQKYENLLNEKLKSMRKDPQWVQKAISEDILQRQRAISPQDNQDQSKDVGSQKYHLKDQQKIDKARVENTRANQTSVTQPKLVSKQDIEIKEIQEAEIEADIESVSIEQQQILYEQTELKNNAILILNDKNQEQHRQKNPTESLKKIKVVPSQKKQFDKQKEIGDVKMIEVSDEEIQMPGGDRGDIGNSQKPQNGASITKPDNQDQNRGKLSKTIEATGNRLPISLSHEKGEKPTHLKAPSPKKAANKRYSNLVAPLETDNVEIEFGKSAKRINRKNRKQNPVSEDFLSEAAEAAMNSQLSLDYQEHISSEEESSEWSVSEYRNQILLDKMSQRPRGHKKGNRKSKPKNANNHEQAQSNSSHHKNTELP